MRPRFYAFLLLLAPLALGSMTLAACDSNGDNETEEITIEELVVGTGPEASVGTTARVDYIGRLRSGTEFDRGQLALVVGTGRITEINGVAENDPRAVVIVGFAQGVEGMRQGGRRRVTIPPSLAYGRQGSGPIPGNATISFELTLLSVTQPPAALR